MAKYSKFTDLELVAMLNKGDQLAYTEIFERYKIILYKHAIRLINDQEEVNDIIQELFLTLWQKKGTIILTTSLSSYLYQSVRNRIFDFIAHQKVENNYLDSIRDFALNGQLITEDQIRMKELNIIIEKEISALPERMRKVFEMSRLTDLSYKQIGERLDISDKTVKQQVYNAVKILKLKINYIITILPII
ncbi:RNA polymerase sigma factor [Pedobacter heparinus]|uniref:RNA polymerase sigma-70 factor n=1 Tax=Pedobacter heparinus (strain ATCC 13125 / DSM 2366 / CIP 104194 / JCM 7457 / NBRC 12017 / NCIMB 9290 / NRRL B-14731 / HIM 762-3) TaxID=485917 RepID=C6XT18_PEDHD|nr:RNA polymerase sigma-70 factor [Pedobacter heparinus]ACU03579.1 RNA polymerase sigma-70 factor [Pedobacter heparinus DSM 2366]